jgi:hypothetical protein
MSRPELLVDGPEGGRTIVLAHGAGAPMDSPFMERIAGGLAGCGLRVVRFEFLYMRERRRVPDPAAVLRESWRSVIDKLGGGAGLVIGGKSLGGRIASTIADGTGARGLVCLGYPFHPPGQPDRLRVAHLAELRTPTLIVQGIRDPFGTPAEIEGYALSPAIRIVYLEDGDHSFNPGARAGRTLAQNLERAVEEVAAFVRSPGGGW